MPGPKVSFIWRLHCIQSNKPLNNSADISWNFLWIDDSKAVWNTSVVKSCEQNFNTQAKHSSIRFNIVYVFFTNRHLNIIVSRYLSCAFINSSRLVTYEETTGTCTFVIVNVVFVITWSNWVSNCFHDTWNIWLLIYPSMTVTKCCNSCLIITTIITTTTITTTTINALACVSLACLLRNTFLNWY